MKKLIAIVLLGITAGCATPSRMKAGPATIGAVGTNKVTVIQSGKIIDGGLFNAPIFSGLTNTVAGTSEEMAIGGINFGGTRSGDTAKTEQNKTELVNKIASAGSAAQSGDWGKVAESLAGAAGGLEKLIGGKDESFSGDQSSAQGMFFFRGPGANQALVDVIEKASEARIADIQSARPIITTDINNQSVESFSDEAAKAQERVIIAQQEAEIKRLEAETAQRIAEIKANAEKKTSEVDVKPVIEDNSPQTGFEKPENVSAIEWAQQLYPNLPRGNGNEFTHDERNFQWKASGEKTDKLVILAPNYLPKILYIEVKGNKLSETKAFVDSISNSNRTTTRFSKNGAQYGSKATVVINTTGGVYEAVVTDTGGNKKWPLKLVEEQPNLVPINEPLIETPETPKVEVPTIPIINDAPKTDPPATSGIDTFSYDLQAGIITVPVSYTKYLVRPPKLIYKELEDGSWNARPFVQTVKTDTPGVYKTPDGKPFPFASNPQAAKPYGILLNMNQSEGSPRSPLKTDKKFAQYQVKKEEIYFNHGAWIYMK